MSVRIRKTVKYTTEVQITVKVVKQKYYKLWYALLDGEHIMGMGQTDKEAILNMLETKAGSKYEKNLRYIPVRRKNRRKKRK